jgi:hypothetical protein
LSNDLEITYVQNMTWYTTKASLSFENGKFNIKIDYESLRANKKIVDEEKRKRINEAKEEFNRLNLNRDQLIEIAAQLQDQVREFRLADAKQRAEKAESDVYSPVTLKYKDSDIELDTIVRGKPGELFGEDGKILGKIFHPLEQAESYISKKRAALGGSGRARHFKPLEDETIRLYLEKAWKSVPEAAMEITPKIVAMSKGNGDLAPTTTKPLEWIRAYKKSLKSSPS